MFTYFLIGFVVGLYGSYRNWSFPKILLIAFIITLPVYLLSSPAHADAKKSFDTLSGTTVHIAIGSGSIVEAPSGRHYMLTNWHVCNAGSWQGKMRGNFEGGILVEGKIAKADPRYDLCATLVSKNLRAIKLSESLYPGQQIYTRGYPYGVLSQTSGQFVGAQSWSYLYPIEEVGTCFPGSRAIRNGMGNVASCAVIYNDNLTNMYSRPGSSGSPVVDDNANLVGVISSWYGETDSGGMVRLEDIRDFFKDL